MHPLRGPRLTAAPIRRPRLRIDRESDRHATWLELFFDLIFAITVSQLAHRLVADVDGRGFLVFLGLFFPIWWAWVGHTVYATRFDADDATHRALTLFQMLCAAIMAVQATRSSADSFAGYAIAYAGMRAGLLAQYARVWRHDPPARPIVGIYLAGFGLGAALCAASAWAPPGLAWPLWLSGLAVDFVVPWVARGVLQRAPLHTTHLPERFGLFTLIVLGESVAGVVRGMVETDLWVLSVLVAVLGFVVAACLWWLYFEHMTRDDVGRRLGSGQPFIYIHLPLVVALAFLSTGVERAVQEASETALVQQTSALLYGGAALWLLAFVVLQRVSVPASATLRRAWPELALAAGSLVLLGVGTRTPPIATLALLALGHVVLVARTMRGEGGRRSSATSP